MSLIYWSVCLTSRRGGYEVKDGVGGGGIVILASFDHFIRVHENLVQHPKKYISICIVQITYSHTLSSNKDNFVQKQQRQKNSI